MARPFASSELENGKRTGVRGRETVNLAHKDRERDDVWRVALVCAPVIAPAQGKLTRVAEKEVAALLDDLTNSRVAVACFHATAPCELLLTRGYAAENSQFVYDTLTTNATGYLAREASLPEHECVSDRFHFAVEYRPDAAWTAFGDRGLPDPHAMSGSLIWNTKFVETSSQGKLWAPSDAVVTGLLWSWPEESRVVATRIEYVRSFLLEAMHKLHGATSRATSKSGQATNSVEAQE
jgi:hypothetical protein